MSLLNPILAQATAPDQVTVGGVISAVMFIVTAIGSIAMIVAWVMRYGQTGHALPAAQRGVLRVPWGLTLFAVALSILFMVLVLASSLVDLVDEVPVVNNLTAGGPAAEVELEGAAKSATDTNGEPTTLPADSATSDTAKTEADTATAGTEVLQTPEPVTEVTAAAETPTVADSINKSETASAEPDTAKKDDAKTAKKPAISPEKMQDALIQTVAMDLVMLLVFGGIVMAASKAGRVHLTDSGTVQPSPANRQSPMFAHQSGPFHPANVYGSPWPDLDDAAAIPQIPGYDILNARKLPNAVRNPDNTHETPAVASIPSASIEPMEHNPYAAGFQDERFASSSEIVEVAAEDILEPDEPFSFTRELRFATEVFLAAYLPTTALRLLIVLISIGISGETPKSHPFLEMLDQGIGIPMIAMILVMAVFIAPIVEELQFRVVVLGGTAQLGWPKAAFVVSSILFAFAHGFPDSIALLPLAFALGYTYLRRRSYVTVMFVHFLFNAFNMILALAALL